MPSSSAEPVESYHSDRHFLVWRYEVGHSQLLIRSVKRDAQTSRIDLLFKAVDAIQRPTSFDGLSIQREAEVFALSGRGWSGSITAGACYQAEDDGEFFDPSPFESTF